MDDAIRRMTEGLLKAIQAEIEGHHFYRMAAQSTSDEKGQEIFQRLAQEELDHRDFLEAHYRSLLETGAPHPTASLGTATELVGFSPIFSENLRERASEAHFEMTALSVAIQLELNAVQFYRQESEAATLPEVQRLFTDLAEWESRHYHALLRQQEALKSDYWSAQGFSPF